MSHDVVIDRFYLPSDREEGYYRYLPVAVDHGVETLGVSLRYDRTRAVIDLGVFSPSGFRGWSGGERDHFEIGLKQATPGYLPGPLAPGEWLVTLGLYRVPREGCEVRVEARTGAPLSIPPASESPSVPQRGSASRPPAHPGHRWVAGDLHAHTVHSDGSLTIEGLAARARAVGLDWLAVTDHNTISHHPHLASVSRRYGLTLLPGQELTTTRGHANCFGEVGWIDFRETPDAWLSHADHNGGLLSINHPLAGDCSWRQSIGSTPHLIEVWHHTWDRRSDAPIRWWRALGQAHPVGGSDFHRPGSGSPGTPTTWVEVEGVPNGDDSPRPEAIMAALRSGRIALSEKPNGPVVVDVGGEIIVCGGDSARLTHEDGLSTTINDDNAVLPSRRGLWRLSDADDRTLALTVVP